MIERAHRQRCQPSGHNGRSEVEEPHLGIFWLVPVDNGEPVILMDCEPLAHCESYGETMTHPRGHYDVWERWRRLGMSGLRAAGLPITIFSTEYETYPRGRVVYSIVEEVFWIYADRRLQRPAIIAEVCEHLRLSSESFIVKSDSHYR